MRLTQKINDICDKLIVICVNAMNDKNVGMHTKLKKEITELIDEANNLEVSMIDFYSRDLKEDEVIKYNMPKLVYTGNQVYELRIRDREMGNNGIFEWVDRGTTITFS